MTWHGIHRRTALYIKLAVKARKGRSIRLSWHREQAVILTGNVLSYVHVLVLFGFFLDRGFFYYFSSQVVGDFLVM